MVTCRLGAWSLRLSMGDGLPLRGAQSKWEEGAALDKHRPCAPGSVTLNGVSLGPASLDGGRRGSRPASL